ncbi:hypothetical protein ACMWD3_04870 [Gardnerella swidsinskii]|uniref:hypothetical protein n=1 Tax=Gardnerella swidsinskii TaxID=2792979 RepID=UPI000E678507|nr:hypothetical protein CJI51_04245 [Bifidobacteriaceae bacterium WP021]
MRINAAYKEELKKILETGDMSRVRQEEREYIDGTKKIAFWILPIGRERADTVVKGVYALGLSCFAKEADRQHELVAQVTDAIKSFLSLAEKTQEYDEIAGEAMLALTEWQKAYKECADAQRECSILVGSDKDFQAWHKIAEHSTTDDEQRSARAKMRIIKRRIIEENRAAFERCYKAQEELENARKTIQAQVETEALEYQEPMSDE